MYTNIYLIIKKIYGAKIKDKINKTKQNNNSNACNNNDIRTIRQLA